MNFLKNSEIEPTSFQKKAQFNFVWRITLAYALISLLMFIFTFFTFVTNDRFSIFYLIVFFVMLLSLFILRKLKVYKTVAIILYLMVSLLIGLVIFAIPDTLHLQEAIWMVVLILTAFFTLGNRWGMFYLVLNSIFFYFYYNYTFVENAQVVAKISKTDLFVLSIEFAIAMFLIGYVMVQYSKVMKQAVAHSSRAYEELKGEKQIVELQNKEKTVLLQEIHHRVKNNLQVIVSLLRIQSREIKSEEAKESFGEAISRILAMSLIHQKLYENESLINIDIKDYLSTLVQNLIRTGTVSKEVDFSVQSKLESVNTKSMVPLGLIINELVSNSIKHAFDQSGRIELTLMPINKEEFSMTYFDNGQWKENDETTFGTQLVEIFTEQLDGTYEREINDKGTFYHFHLKEMKQD